MRLQRTTVAATAVIASLFLATLAVPASAAPATDTSHDKTHSPETDLQHYPKRHDVPGTKPAEASRSQVVGQVVSVEVVRQLPGGITDSTMYTPAPGVTTEALAARLRSQTAAGAEVVAGGDTVQPTMAAAAYAAESCSYGTARSVTCPPLHWANNGYSDPQVYFNDHSGAGYPTDQAVYTWNQSVGIDSYYRWNSCSTAAGTHCVNVYSANAGPTGWSGLTHRQWDSANNYIDGSVYSQFNDYYSYNADGYRQVACHELGHALGLGHNVQSYSCMWYQIMNSAHRLPDSDDFNMLASIYSVVR